MDEAKKAELLENIEKEIQDDQKNLVGSQCRPRKKTLRPSHLVKADRRAKNKIARKSRKANKIRKGSKVLRPKKTNGNGHQSPRPNRNQSTK